MKSRKLIALLCRPRETISGATAAEYGVIAAAVCLVFAAVIFFFGHDIAGTFTAVREAFTSAS